GHAACHVCRLGRYYVRNHERHDGPRHLARWSARIFHRRARGLRGCFGDLLFLPRASLRPAGASSIRSLLKFNPSFVELSFTSYIGSFLTPLGLLVVRVTVLDNFGAATAGILQAAIGISLGVHLILSPLYGLLLTPLVNRTLADNTKLKETHKFLKNSYWRSRLRRCRPFFFRI